ncbi:MAG: hypothetical protein HY900_31945, partial [Deltaproteobacteria bacterium]|nr:hypothetical protein [Deltaproteobacteria bacterium]
MNGKILLVPLLVSSLLAAGPALAAEYWLCAGATAKEMPDGAVVTMWGFAQDNNNNLSDGCGGQPQVPGPELVVLPEDSTGLIVHLRNDLPVLNGEQVRVSLFIQGQASSAAGAPATAFFTDAQSRERARSFIEEALPGAPVTYVWREFKPGTYLYMSGTHPAVQVQMGLYGMACKDAGPGLAYAGVPYDRAVALLYSEIDPGLHAAVQADDYGPGKSVTSTFNYHPEYFLVNGEPYVRGVTPEIPAGNVGQRILIRFANAGLQPHVPVLQGGYLKLVAEDGNPYPYSREQYSVLLPAGKAMDAIFTPGAGGTYAIHDQRMNLTNALQTPGGLMSFLKVNPPVLYFSTLGNAAVPGVAGPYDDADIYAWDGTAFSRVFRASAAGLPADANVDALKVVDADTFYLSFNRNAGTA